MSLTVNQVVGLIAIHSIIHGIAGTFLVSTSFYVNYNSAIISCYLAANACLIILGFLMFCVIVWRSEGLCRFYAVVMVFVMLFNIAAGVYYYVEYFPFFANSIFDAYFFYTDTECWVGSDFTTSFWHVITGLLVGFLALWFLYICLLCKMADALRCCPPAAPCMADPNCRPPSCPKPCPPPCPKPCPPPCPPPCHRKSRKIQKYVDEVRCSQGRCERTEKWVSRTPHPRCPPPYSPPSPKKAIVLTLKPRI